MSRSVGANLGANAGSIPAAASHEEPLSLLVKFISGFTQPRQATVVRRLTSEGSQVRNLLRPPERPGQRLSLGLSGRLS